MVDRDKVDSGTPVSPEVPAADTQPLGAPVPPAPAPASPPPPAAAYASPAPAVAAPYGTTQYGPIPAAPPSPARGSRRGLAIVAGVVGGILLLGVGFGGGFLVGHGTAAWQGSRSGVGVMRPGDGMRGLPGGGMGRRSGSQQPNNQNQLGPQGRSTSPSS